MADPTQDQSERERWESHIRMEREAQAERGDGETGSGSDGVKPSAPLSDERVKELAAKAGLRWLDPIPDEDGGVGYPGGFDMSSLDEIRALIGGVAIPSVSVLDKKEKR
jgi:hypothetical protein